MAKKGMRRYTYDEKPGNNDAKNSVAPVPEIQGKAKYGNKKARPIIAGTESPELKVYHNKPHSERPISNVYKAIDTDLARDNLENDISAADLQDM